MKTKKNVIILSLILAFIVKAGVQAQETFTAKAVNHSSYKNAIGFRAGETSGLTIKRFLSDRGAMEAIIGFRGDAVSLTGLYEYHVPTGLTGFRWYFGGGGHVAAGTGRTYYYMYDPGPGHYYRKGYYYSNGEVGMGADGIFGVEYKIPRVPFVVSSEIKPFLEMNNSGYWFFAIDPGLGIRLIF